MTYDDDFDFDDFDEGEDVVASDIAPTAADVFETMTLMHLEAGRITERDLADLDPGNMPQAPLEEMSDQDRAQWLAFAAYQFCFEDPEGASEMADQALSYDEFCIDAYVALWFLEETESEEAIALAAQGAIRGQHLIDATKESRQLTDLWMYPRLRGVVRAYAALALSNWAYGNHDDAIEAAEHVLKLAPHDDVGITPYLANWYLVTGQKKRAYRLLREYTMEGSAAVEYARALVAFVREGPQKARAALRMAVERHPMILAFMMPSPDEELVSEGGRYPSHYYSPGTWEDVAVWQALVEETWRSVPGALGWAVERVKEPDFAALLAEGMMDASDTVARMLAQEGLDPDGPIDGSGSDAEDDDDPAGDPELRLL